jgi:hypothetical protein
MPFTDRNTDEQVVDAIATVLGTAERWSADQLETIANLIGYVRPHPGGQQADYRPLFKAATGRDVDARFDRDERVGDEYDDGIAGVRP